MSAWSGGGILSPMHEWALADAVIESTASALAGRDPSCLRAVNVLIGELQAIEREIFDFALTTLLAERPFKGAVYRVQTEPASFRCEKCGREWSLSETTSLTAETREAIHFLPEAAHAFVRCPGCGSPDYRIVRGRGVSIASMDLVDKGECR